MERAVELTARLSAVHLSSVARMTGSAPAEAGRHLSQAVDRMAKKLTAAGTCTKRDLYRRYNRQSSLELDPVLEAAIAQGRIVRLPEGKLASATLEETSVTDITSVCQ